MPPEILERGIRRHVMTREQSIVCPGTHAGSVREAWTLAFPTIIAQLSTTLMWISDTVILGRVGKVELAAAGLGGVLIWTLYTFFVGGVQAVNTFVAQAKGANRPRECAVFAWQGIYFSIAGGLVLLLFTWKFDWILALARPDAAVIRECLRYSRIRMAGSFFVLGSFSMMSFFRGIGDVRTPMMVAILANIVNIVLAILLVFGIGPFPRLTTYGAGLATMLANVFGFGLLLIPFLRPKLAAIYHTRTDHPFRPREMMRLLKVGVPIGLQFFQDMGSFSVLMAVMGRLGTNQLAASQIALQTLSLSYMPAGAIGRAATTLVGQYIGAGRMALAETCGWVVVRMNLVYSLGVAAVLLLLGGRIVGLVNNDPAVVQAGARIMPILAILQIMDAMQMSYSGALQGAGDTTFTMIAYGASCWLLFVPLALLFAYPLGWGMPGGWAGGAIHLTVLSAVLTLRYRSGVWKKRVI